MVQSKSKGNQFENKVLRDIRKFWPDAYKTIGSGNAADDKGDLVYRKNCIECKHHKTIRNLQVDRWWGKICDEADRMKKEPILIYKENNKQAMVMFWSYVGGDEGAVRHMMFYPEWLGFEASKIGGGGE